MKQSPSRRAALRAPLQVPTSIQAAAYSTIEVLESRRLMSVSIVATKSQASDINPHTSGQGLFTFSRTGSTAGALEIDFSVAPQSTAASSRYAPLPSDVIIPAGKASVKLAVNPLLDAVPLPTQSLTLSVNSSSAYTINPKHANATVKITDKAPTVSIVATKANASEANPTSTGLGKFTVTRKGGSNEALTVNYTLDPSSTAVNGLDYNAISGSVVIPKGKNSALINVVPIADHLLEPTRSLKLDLALGGYFQTAKNSAAITIADDGSSTTPRATVVTIATQTNASEAAPGTPGQFVVTRTGMTSSDLTVNYVVSGTATAGVDYSALSGSVVIPAGQTSATINVTPAGDATTDPLTVIVTLTNSGQATAPSATLTLAAGQTGNVPAGWFDTAYHERLPISVNVGSTARVDKTVDEEVNFTQALSDLGQSGTLNENSIRVVETTADGSTVLNANVPFQFDKDTNYNAATNASGDLVFMMTGNTAANTTRYYHVYYDTGTGFTAPTVTPLVTTTDNTTDQGQTTVTIATPTATYDLQKDNGGFSSILDKDGNNWLTFNPTSGSGSSGEYRGFPNAVYNGGFHAGFNFGSTQIVNTGPLKTTLLTTISLDTGNGNPPSTYVMKYEIYSDHMTATMLRADDTYWFLYEGTPGGTTSNNKLNLNDFIVQSDGTTTPVSQTFNDTNGVGNGNGQEWLYFDSPSENRYLFMVKNDATSQLDEYYDLNDDMTVFGFGRDNSLNGNAGHLLSGTNSFTIGIADGGTDFNSASTQINGTYQALTTATGNGSAI